VVVAAAVAVAVAVAFAAAVAVAVVVVVAFAFARFCCHSERSEEPPHFVVAFAFARSSSIHQKRSGAPSIAQFAMGGMTTQLATTPLPLQLLVFRCHPERSRRTCGCLCRCLSRCHSRTESTIAVACLITQPKNRHFDQGRSRLCERRSGEIRFSASTSRPPYFSG
jgi:hypothetical protein